MLVLTLSSRTFRPAPSAPDLHSLTARPLTAPRVSPLRLHRSAWVHQYSPRPASRSLARTAPDSRSIPSPEGPAAMRPLPHRMPLPIPRLAWLLGLLLAGLSGCGPASSGDAPSLEPRASVARPSESPPVWPHTPSTPHDPVTPGASPAPLASGLSSAGQGEARPAEPLVVPAWMANALDSPDVRVRLKALDRWAQQAPPGAVEPLVLALEDKDERVQARALELIAQDWMHAQAGKPEAEP